MLAHGKSRLTFKIKQFKQKHDIVSFKRIMFLARSSSSLMRRLADRQLNGQSKLHAPKIDKSTLVGMVYERPWIDQWRPGCSMHIPCNTEYCC